MSVWEYRFIYENNVRKVPIMIKTLDTLNNVVDSSLLTQSSLKSFLSIKKLKSLFVIDGVFINSWMSSILMSKCLRIELSTKTYYFTKIKSVVSWLVFNFPNFSCFLKPSPSLRAIRPEGIVDLSQSMTSSSNLEMNVKVTALSTPACASSAMIKTETLSGKW